MARVVRAHIETGKCAVERRRRVPRQAVRWSGKCLLEDEAGAGWAECQVLDISLIGVGIEIYGRLPSRPSSVGAWR